LTRGKPKPPPADFKRRTLPTLSAKGTYYRCAAKTRPLVDWDSRDTSRFSHPSLPFPVLYLSGDKLTGFWECFGDELNDQPQEDKALYKSEHLEPRQWVRFQIGLKLHVIDITDVATLRKIGADAGTFLADYTITLQWAKQLMEHPAHLDGFFYSSRLDGGRRCLAVFGRPPLFNSPATFQAKSEGPLLEDLDLLLFLAREKVSII
jgi:hypothetical protein